MGWTDATLVDVFMRFLAQHQMEEAFADFADDIAQQEVDAGSEGLNDSDDVEV